MDVVARRSAYGPGPAQFGELYLPPNRPNPPNPPNAVGTVVVLHGGFWRSAYDLSLGRPLARDLAARGYAAWNVEYRRVGNGGGWPTTFEDVAAAIDHLARLDLDTSNVVTVGHSAGGHLAVWAAGRGGLPDGAPGARPAVRVTAAVAQAGVLDLATSARNGVGHGAAIELVGADPHREPQRWAVADPMAQLPLGVPVLCVHAPDDDTVPFAQSEGYVRAALAAGDPAGLIRAAGDHFTLIDPDSPDWHLVLDALPGLMHRVPG